MIVSQPKAGKTTLLKEIAKSVTKGNPDMHLIILLIDERDRRRLRTSRKRLSGENVEVIYSTFDELPEHHKRVSEMVIERAKRLVEHGKDVMILLDSITRLARAYNLRFRQADVRYPEVLTRQRCTCRSAFSVRPETCVREKSHNPCHCAGGYRKQDG